MFSVAGAFDIRFFALIKFVALSDQIECGIPRRAMNGRKADVNASVDKSATDSMWTSRVVRYIKNTA